MKLLLAVTVVIELGAGLALLIWPSTAVALLLGPSLGAQATLAIGRLAGTALSALGVAIGLISYNGHSSAAKGATTVMMVYNLGAVVLLSAVGFRLHPVGIALWPSVALHGALTIWCVTCLRKRPENAFWRARRMHRTTVR